eukprot:gene915-249_t
MKFVNDFATIDWPSKLLGIKPDYAWFVQWETIIACHAIYLIMAFIFWVTGVRKIHRRTLLNSSADTPGVDAPKFIGGRSLDLSAGIHYCNTDVTWPKKDETKPESPTSPTSPSLDGAKVEKKKGLLHYSMLIYNGLQVIISFTMVIELGRYLQPENPFYFNGEKNAHIEFWIWVHYVTKYFDFFDTFWIGIKRSSAQFSFLHIYHHLTIGAIWGSLLHVGLANGTAYYGAWVNSVVHTIMYGYYFCTALGKPAILMKIMGYVKPWITRGQQLQFFTCVVHA